MHGDLALVLTNKRPDDPSLLHLLSSVVLCLPYSGSHRGYSCLLPSANKRPSPPYPLSTLFASFLSIELACPQETLLFHAKPQGTFPLNLTVASRIELKTSILS
ncbi:hypothetical protein Ac2012v2_007465 [Leucoagaricus gongylophorus]